MTAEAIIADMLSNYTDGTFTMANVSCDINITKVTFSRITVMAAIQRLSDLTSYSWYVDYQKDLHFFESNTEVAPFAIADGDGNSIPDSFSVKDDFSQIRNRVFIKGGEVEGELRSESYNGDAVKDTFSLANKFSKLPTVTVGGVTKTVGVDYIDDADSFDCLWSFETQYIKFKASSIPAVGTNNIVITGIPLYTLVVQVEDPASVAQYGIFEYAKTDTSLKSKQDAIAMARADIAAYKDGVIDVSFDTYTSGLRSGQILNVQSSLFDINDTYVVQNVTFKQVTEDRGLWHAELATLRTLGIIELLIQLLKKDNGEITDSSNEVLEKTVFPMESIGIADAVSVNTNDVPTTETLAVHDDVYTQALNFNMTWVLGPYVPTPSNGSDIYRVFLLDRSLLI